MFRLWGKEFKDKRMLKDLVICDESDDTRTHKIFHALDEICYEFPTTLNADQKLDEQRLQLKLAAAEAREAAPKKRALRETLAAVRQFFS